MNFMEVSGNQRNPARCSDDSCPCGYPGDTIPRGKGYMYISKEVVDFRRDCLLENEAQRKLQQLSLISGSRVVAGPGVLAPVLMCEQGARKRDLDLAVAAKDAKRWWGTGLVPLRVTPLAGSEPPAASAKWWQFWK